MQLERDDNHRYGIGIPLSELQGLGMRGDRWSASDVKFTLRRDAGTVAFSVCDPEVCLIEKVPVSAAVAAK